MGKLVVIIVVFLLLSVLALVAMFLLVPAYIDTKFNTIYAGGEKSSQRAEKLHKELLIVDHHADSLLWKRDLLARNTRGHVDVPRLIEGNVALQAFTIVTKVPRGVNINRNNSASDDITLLAIAELWPPPTWVSLKERALYQADKLHGFAGRSAGKLTIIKSVRDLDSYLERRKSDKSITAGFLGVEGAHCLEGDLKNIDLFFDHGIRMMAPTHFHDNDIGGSKHGVKRGGLTQKGKQMIVRMQAKSMIVDLAHASSAVIKDVLSIATRPVIVSHTGVKGTCKNNRNLSDQEIRGIAKTGGLICIGFWKTAVCGKSARAIAKAIRYTSKIAGADHVGLGSDYDGTVTVPFDSSNLVVLTDALLAEGFTEAEIRKIMGENSIRFLRSVLPDE